MRYIFTAPIVFVFVFVFSVSYVHAASEQAPTHGTEKQGQFSIKLRTLEERINSLKDKIFRAKQKLSILHETVLSGTIAGARATITHQNDVGRAFSLVSMIYHRDDAPAFKRINAPDELKQNTIVVFDGSLVPGPHHVSVYLLYKGRGFGFFSYMKGYDLKVQSGRSFNVVEGTISEMFITVKDKGSVAKLKDRLYLQFESQQKDFAVEIEDDNSDGVKSKNE